MSVRPIIHGFTTGCFDSLDGKLHPGHVLLLQVASNHCDVLTVAVNRDDYCRRKKGLNRPLLPLLDRMESVRRVAERFPCKTIVRVLMEDHPRGLLSRLKPDILIVGSDYRGQPLPGVLHCQRVIYVERINGVSTTLLAGR
jgi:cytidyltransferase-like protein